MILQTLLNSSNTIDKADEYEYLKFGVDSERSFMSDSLLTAPGKLCIKSKDLLQHLYHKCTLVKNHQVKVVELLQARTSFNSLFSFKITI